MVGGESGPHTVGRIVPPKPRRFPRSPQVRAAPGAEGIHRRRGEAAYRVRQLVTLGPEQVSQRHRQIRQGVEGDEVGVIDQLSAKHGAADSDELQRCSRDGASGVRDEPSDAVRHAGWRRRSRAAEDVGEQPHRLL